MVRPLVGLVDDLNFCCLGVVAVYYVCTHSISFRLYRQRPFLLQGHERPITVVKYNYDGDLLFTASKDQTPSVWRSENGERLGTYGGHKGTIWDLDIDRFSRHLLTASADAYVYVGFHTGE